MVHGGPYPATSDARGTSVGTLAIERYLRPVCYQNYPDHLLPLALQNTNPLGIARLVNGEMSKAFLIFKGVYPSDELLFIYINASQRSRTLFK